MDMIEIIERLESRKERMVSALPEKKGYILKN